MKIYGPKWLWKKKLNQLGGKKGEKEEKTSWLASALSQLVSCVLASAVDLAGKLRKKNCPTNRLVWLSRLKVEKKKEEEEKEEGRGKSRSAPATAAAAADLLQIRLLLYL